MRDRHGRVAKIAIAIAAPGIAILCGRGNAEPAEAPAKTEVAVLIASAPAPDYICLRDFYVDPVAGRHWTAYAHDGGSRDRPWRSLLDANDALDAGKPVLRAGDCVNLAAGRYALRRGVRLTRGGSRNAADGYVVYRSAEPHAARLVAAAPIGAMIDIKAAYIILDGLEIDGNGALATGEGVAVSGSAAHHHIVVRHCRIHDLGGGGVQLNDSEFFWIIDNDIFRTASTRRNQESGISVYQPQAAEDAAPSPDDDIPFHIVIVGNRSHDNVETFACAEAPGCHTDGNGVIVDKTRNVDRAGGVPYPGRTLVAANFVYGNGGAGVHLFLSEHVTVAGNLAVRNHVDAADGATWRGELSNVDSGDALWLGNIAWAMPGRGVSAHNSAILIAATGDAAPRPDIAWRANLTCGGDPSVYARAVGPDSGGNRFDADPRACRKAAAIWLGTYAAGW